MRLLDREIKRFSSSWSDAIDMLSLVSVEDYNRRVAEALERAQKAAGIRSGEAFARAMADHVGGAPAGSTFRRWVQEQQAIPAWALLAAAEMTGLSLDALVGGVEVSAQTGSTDLGARVLELGQQVEALQRQVADLQVEAMDRASAQPAVAEREREEERRRASGA